MKFNHSNVKKCKDCHLMYIIIKIERPNVVVQKLVTNVCFVTGDVVYLLLYLIR